MKKSLGKKTEENQKVTPKDLLKAFPKSKKVVFSVKDFSKGLLGKTTVPVENATHQKEKCVQNHSISLQEFKKLKTKSKTSQLEDNFFFQLKASNMPLPLRQYKFKDSRYLFDFAFVEHRVLVEIDGGIYMPRSGHSSPKGYLRDRKKEMFALKQGFLLIRFCTPQIKDWSAVKDLNEILSRIDTKNFLRPLSL